MMFDSNLMDVGFIKIDNMKEFYFDNADTMF
jgi:hypothetical protein